MRAWSGRKTTCEIVTYHKGEPYPAEVYRDCDEMIPSDAIERIACSDSTLSDKAKCWEGKKAIACKIEITSEGTPNTDEVAESCDLEVYTEWMQQEPCTAKNKRTCEGYYLHLANKTTKEREVGKQLDPATAWLSLEDCHAVPSSSTNICEDSPTLVITGQEPIPGEAITRIEGTYSGEPFSCAGSVCKFHVAETDEEGAAVEFWAYSSYGDSSFIHSAQVRVKKADEGDPDQLYYYVDVLSSQWYGQPVATCADAWGIFPPVGGPAEWLTTPKQSKELSSDIPYTYLAANLIKQGVTDADGCPDGGISPGGAANQCGLESARAAVTDWQNQFDDLILKTGKETGVPAYLLKNLFARESQFWPGSSPVTVSDVGLGQLTENGADTTLFWNSSFYEQFCPMVLSEKKCKKKYMNLSEIDQIALRQGLVRSVNATCEDCPLGLDLARADFSIIVFAHTLIANCNQAGQVVLNYAADESSVPKVMGDPDLKQHPGDFATYEELWKFTLANYNVGGGCLANAISNFQAFSYGQDLDLTWDNVSPYMTGACSPSIDYINDISK